MLQELNRNFGVGESVVFVEGKGGLTKAHLRESGGHELEVYLFGAHITEWKTPKRKDLFFLSSQSDFSGTKPIRGGIPLVFPQFGGGPLPAHGFARTTTWTPKKTSSLPSGEVEFILGMTDNAQTKAIWPYAFEAELQIRLSNKLTTNFKVTNRDSKPFSFQNAFHTYFAVGDIKQVEVTPLKGLTFLDSTKNRAPGNETNDKVTFAAETDRVYVKAPDTLTIRDQSKPLTFTIKKSGLKDAIVWNPWTDRCKAIQDLPDDSFHSFVCVESANVVDQITVSPGQSWECSQVIEYI